MLSTKYYMIKLASEELKAKDVEDRREELLRKLVTAHNTGLSIRRWSPLLGSIASFGLGMRSGSKSPIKNTLAGMGGGLLTGNLLNAFFVNPKIRSLKKELFELDGVNTDMI